MKVSLAWLQEWVKAPLDAAELETRLTMAGLEVDSCRALDHPAADTLVAARVMDVRAHPHADRLQVCRVDDGGGKLRQLVCGAPNVQSGRCFPCARPGARLAGQTIKETDIRGVRSEGMLCSAAELGLSQGAEGLLVLPESCTPGTDLVDKLVLNDTIIELELTPNRGDCLGMLGLSREVCALLELPFEPVVPVDVN